MWRQHGRAGGYDRSVGRRATALPPLFVRTLPAPHFFLVERYCLYTVHWRQLSRVRIFHRPWPLRRVERLSFTSIMLESQGLPTPLEDPRLHAQGEPLRVGIWPPERL